MRATSSWPDKKLPVGPAGPLYLVPDPAVLTALIFHGVMANNAFRPKQHK
jgi:hypothetical protein